MAKNSNGESVSKSSGPPAGWRKSDRQREIWWKPLVNSPIVVDVLQRAEKDDDMRDDGIQVYYQCRLVESAQHETKEGRETLEKGALINVSESYQLKELGDNIGGRCWIKFTGDDKIKGGKTVKNFEIAWDDSRKPQQAQAADDLGF